MASTISFQGVTTGLQTDSLISAIMSRESLGVERLQARQALNTKRSTALNAMRTGMNTLATSMAKLYDSFANRTVTSSDANGTYATATASGAASGGYDVKVTQVATRGRLGPVMVQDPAYPGDPTKQIPSTLAAASPTSEIITGAGTYKIRGTDGVEKEITVTDKSLNGLCAAINASGAGVMATVINTGKGGNQYQLVMTAKETGTGTGTNGIITLTATGTTTDTLGISATGATGLSSAGSEMAVNAIFSVNGIEMTRQSNTVTDAVDGMTFTLKKGDASNATTLTVAQDRVAATTALQDVISNYNAVLKTYKDAAASVNDGSDEPTPGPLSNDSVAKSVINDLRSILHETPGGLPETAARSLAELGVKTNVDGTLSLDTKVFLDALDKDSAAVKNVFTNSGGTGIGQTLQAKIAELTSYSGSIETTRTSLDDQNRMLATRIESGQKNLDKRKASLKAQFDKMEYTVAVLRSASSSLGGIG